MQLQILGTGCPKCETLAKNTKCAAETLGLEYELVKIQDINEITKLGVMITPALAIDGVVKLVGKVPSPEEIATILRQTPGSD